MRVVVGAGAGWLVKGTGVAVGVFDGVHVGHARVLAALRGFDRARVVTFDPHPAAAPELLCSVERRLELIREHGVDAVDVVHPGTAVELDGATLVMGGSVGPGAHVLAVPLVEGVSSALIRRLVAAHELEAAARMLGRPFEVEGVVVVGDRRGRLLGFPTANLRRAPGLLVPPNGIYAGAALGRRAAISIGVNPHYGGAERRVEAHLLDFDGDLYGSVLRVELWSFLREERAFSSEAALVAAIAADVDAARACSPPAGSSATRSGAVPRLS